MAKKSNFAPKIPKGDPTKAFDVIISVIHDDRAGHTAPVEKPKRYSFAIESDAMQLAQRLNQIAQQEAENNA